MSNYDGLNLGLGNLSRLSRAQTRSISAENPTGEKGKGGMAESGLCTEAAKELGVGWKMNPAIAIAPGETAVLADIKGPGVIQSLWMSGFTGRDFILRIFWDGQEQASVETPLPDFFGLPWGAVYKDDGKEASVCINSTPVTVAPKSGLNCFWEMPFKKRCVITIENLHPTESQYCFYQINYALTEIPDECAYFHAQFRRTNPLPYKDVYTIVDGIEGWGHYVGTSMGWGINNSRWWGEGEIKFYVDGDTEWPTICGTGTEDYFGGSWDWVVNGSYQTYTTPYLGMHQVIKPDGVYESQHRHAMYRWHIMDPVRFEKDLRISIQALGWRSDKRFLPGQHDICSVAFWYQTLPSRPFPPLPDRNALEVL